jgi:hypothetical protein
MPTLTLCRQAAFVGTGRTLGSEASTSGAASIPAQTSAEGEWAGVDEGKPTTSLQLRLADGSRMVGERMVAVGGWAGKMTLLWNHKADQQLYNQACPLAHWVYFS